MIVRTRSACGWLAVGMMALAGIGCGAGQPPEVAQSPAPGMNSTEPGRPLPEWQGPATPPSEDSPPTPSETIPPTAETSATTDTSATSSTTASPPQPVKPAKLMPVEFHSAGFRYAIDCPEGVKVVDAAYGPHEVKISDGDRFSIIVGAGPQEFLDKKEDLELAGKAVVDTADTFVTEGTVGGEKTATCGTYRPAGVQDFSIVSTPSDKQLFFAPADCQAMLASAKTLRPLYEVPKEKMQLWGHFEKDPDKTDSGNLILRLSGSPVTDSTLKHLNGWKELEALNLSGCRITDAGIAQIKDLSGLKQLYLTDTPVTDASVKPLSALKSLELLDLKETQLTDAGLEKLKAALPDARIER